MLGPRPPKAIDYFQLVLDAVKYAQRIFGKEGQIKVGGRDLYYKIEARFFSLKEPLVWDCYIVDVQSGISVKAKHYKGQNGALEHAVKELCAKLRAAGLLPNENGPKNLISAPQGLTTLQQAASVLAAAQTQAAAAAVLANSKPVAAN